MTSVQRSHAHARITKIVAISAVIPVIAGTGSLPATQAIAQEAERTFAETGKTVSGRFLTYWNEHGGLAQQGFPISEQMQEKSEIDGKTYTVQYFERAVFEMHPENQAPYDVLLSLLGSMLYKQKYPGEGGAPGQVASKESNARRFPETGKSVGGIFLQYWESHGGLAQQGLPISEEFEEKSELDGKTYRVQYFERAVFEHHPENQAPNNVLLSQLGTFRYKAVQAQNGSSNGQGQGQVQPTPVSSAGASTAGSVSPTGRMMVGRGCHTATLLQDGRVLITGGQQRNGNILDTAELYDPSTGKFTPTASMSTPRVCHQAVLLPGGKVLLVAGSYMDGHKGAELYDPATGTFEPTGSLNEGRDEPFRATLLKNGKVLISGGFNGKAMASAELYDPATGKFTMTGNMNEPRVNHTATMLQDGRVLIVGGGLAAFEGITDYVTPSAEIYDPATGTFSRTGSLITARYKHGAAALTDGRVLIVSGSDQRQLGGLIATAEIFDPAIGTFTATGSVSGARYKILGAVAALPDGKVAMGGGANVEVFDPASGTFRSAGGNMEHDHFWQGATLLPNGTVLFTGGHNRAFLSSSGAWIYRP